MKKILVVFGVGLLAIAAQADFELTELNTPHSGNFEGWNGAANPPHFALQYQSWMGYYDLDGAYRDVADAFAFRSHASGDVLGWGVRVNENNPVEYIGLHLVNRTGTPISRLHVSWNAAQYTEAGRASSIRMAGATGPATIISDVFTATVADPEVRSNLSPIRTSPQTATISFGTPLEDGAKFFIEWGMLTGSGTGANAHIGFADFSVTVVHTVSTPSTPAGPEAACVDQELSYTTGGSACSQGDGVEYQFDWGDGTQSDWGGASRDRSYASRGTYDIKARARCAAFSFIVSEWSDARTATISHTVSPPDQVSGPSKGRVGQLLSFTVGGAACCAGHDILYTVNWGDGISTSWSSETTYQKTYAAPGVYSVVAAAWCPLDPLAFSGNSHAKYVEIVDHWVESPARPAGPDSGCINESLTFTAPRQQCNQEHDVQRQFDWGDGTLSDWGSHTRSKSYGTAGSCQVRVRARCVEDTTVVSDWSPARVVTVEHTVSVPAVPTGPDRGAVGQGLMFSTQGGVCCGGHGVEYQFDWGDGSQSDWGGASRIKAFGGEDKYGIRARARCASDPAVQSDWSEPFVVFIEEASVRIVSIEIVPVKGGHEARVSFIGQAGRWYTLLFAPDLVKASGAGWTPVESMMGTGGLDVMSHEVDAPVGFYRIKEDAP